MHSLDFLSSLFLSLSQYNYTYFIAIDPIVRFDFDRKLPDVIARELKLPFVLDA